MSNQNHLSAVSTIPEAIEAVKAEATEITPSQLAHLQRVYAEAEQAQQNSQKAIAQNQACSGARNSFMAFLSTEYGLANGDAIDLKTGKINRKA
jgi:hypothetical protein